MDATCNVQDSIHVFHLVHNMCPGFWVHINFIPGVFYHDYFTCFASSSCAFLFDSSFSFNQFL